MSEQRVVVMGLGNLLWADEGFGVRVAERLYAHYHWPEYVEIVDGGTQGLNLLGYVESASHLLILDAIDYGLEPGTLRTYAGERIPAYLSAKKMSLHQNSFSEVPWDRWTAVIRQDLALLLERLPGLENLAWNDGTPFADEVTRNWIAQQVMMREDGAWFAGKAAVPTDDATNDVLALEPEALEMADSQGVEAALGWIQTRPGITTARQRLLLRLLMARVAEQYGKNEMALLLLEELDTAAQGLTLTQWEPDLLFEVKARQLKLLRLRAHRYADKALLNRKMEILLGTLVTIDPVRAAVLCDTQHKD